ncbi:hypothetical protein JL720_7725 [Aureococcus anophagefferens]|nr:hypothetical protein JL720_7725 [Aureococcus anophagefferens]
MGRGRGLPITSGDPNVPDEYGDMALVGAARSGQVGVIRVLLAHGAKTGIQDGFGWLPLSAAASRGHVEAVEVLVKEGKADIDAQAQDRLTALMWAARAGRLEVIRCLLKLGANLDLRRDARDDDDPEDAEWTRDGTAGGRREPPRDAARAGGWKKFARARPRAEDAPRLLFVSAFHVDLAACIEQKTCNSRPVLMASRIMEGRITIIILATGICASRYE